MLIETVLRWARVELGDDHVALCRDVEARHRYAWLAPVDSLNESLTVLYARGSCAAAVAAFDGATSSASTLRLGGSPKSPAARRMLLCLNETA
jgi:hypothetical protein